ncbi:hypothetical protein [Chamaesiphon polymorphus]|uniref:Uncharacterized protein n=1 Tax=Chamaesiphon polymorphus CCALA 037 TaxID=2107692 RepID=A0A2T1GJM8_9CYAN|nr:hypothetical protein [Chamaesiphon polymorphus]PSB57997.1 hypothetical protein C7B77_06415 [Chamaesiphon polymorphus CCALA 037]
MNISSLLEIASRWLPWGFFGTILLNWLREKFFRKIDVCFPDRNLGDNCDAVIKYEDIDIKCTSYNEIKADDFRIPIKIYFASQCTIKSYKLIYKSGCNVKPEIVIDEQNKCIYIEPLRLIKDDKFSIRIEYSGLLYPAKLEGKIQNGEIIADSQQSRYRKKSRFYLYSNFFFYGLWLAANIPPIFGLTIPNSTPINLFILGGLSSISIWMHLQCHKLDDRCSKVFEV